MKTIAVVPNTAKTVWKESTQHLLDQLCGMDVDILMPEGCQQTMQQGCIRFVSQKEMMEKSEMLLSLGGDGTLMRAAKYAGPAGIPVLGINMGHLGYLVELEISDYEQPLRQALAGQYTIDQRMMLEVEVIRNGRRVGHTLVLNDAFVARGTVGHMITTQVNFDGIPMNTYMGDGIIIATPTGSTAYSLSAGGAVLEPQSNNILVTPICPHSLGSRPIVLSGSRVITLQVQGAGKDGDLVCDGDFFMKLSEEDIVRIYQSDAVLKLVRVRNRSFYDILREKLR